MKKNFFRQLLRDLLAILCIDNLDIKRIHCITGIILTRHSFLQRDAMPVRYNAVVDGRANRG